MDKPLTIYAEIDDQELADRFVQTIEREKRSRKAVIERALAEYIERSEREAAKTAGKTKTA